MKRTSDIPIYITLSVLCLFIAYDLLSKPKSLKAQAIKPNTTLHVNIADNIVHVDVQGKKKEFVELIVPIVNKVYKELEDQYHDIANNLNNIKYRDRISELKNKYKASSDEELLMALKPHPKSIAIAQAAIESAWAKSRFFKEANNLYGMWSINKDKPRIAASQTRGEKIIWLKKYPNIEESIKDYYKTLARSKAYKDFRELKMQTDDPLVLVQKLHKYSEIGEKYTQDLSNIIKYNRLYMYDKKLLNSIISNPPRLQEARAE